MISDERLAELEKVTKEATPGPWSQCTANDGACQCGLVWATPRDGTVASAHRPGEHDVSAARTQDEQAANARFIATARVGMGELLAEVKRLRTSAAAPSAPSVVPKSEGADHCLFCGSGTDLLWRAGWTCRVCSSRR